MDNLRTTPSLLTGLSIDQDSSPILTSAKVRSPTGRPLTKAALQFPKSRPTELKVRWSLLRDQSAEPDGLRIDLTLNAKCLGGFEFAPVPRGIEAVCPDLAAALLLGAIADLDHDGLVPGSIIVRFPDALHPGWAEVFDRYCAITGRPSIRLSAQPWSQRQQTPQGRVALVSGGKDTLAALTRASRQAPLAGTAAVYLGAGAEDGWRIEICSVRRVVAHYGMTLHHVQMFRYPHSHRGALRFSGRAAWRETFLICLARSLGREIITGINDDALSRLEPPYNTDRHVVPFFGQLRPTIEALQNILDCEIHMLPGEFLVYALMRKDPLYEPSGSCLLPDSCSSHHPCNKCHTFRVYNKVLSGKRLSADDISFIHSPGWLGDASLRSFYLRLDHAA
jgi:hypothetical protein